MLKTESYNV